MGMRYYAWAYEEDQAGIALEEPRKLMSDWPLADAWGLVPNNGSSLITGPRKPKSEMLYLDKTWHIMQSLTWRDWFSEKPARPCARMFEGYPTSDDGFESWESFVRGIMPDEVPAIADDLESMTDGFVKQRIRADAHDSGSAESDIDYVLPYLHSAQEFVREVADTGRGFVYSIG